MIDLPKEIISHIALNLNLSEILSLCLTSKKLNISIYKNKYFWIKLLYRDFGLKYLDIGTNESKIYYKFFIEHGKKDIKTQLREAAKEENEDVFNFLGSDCTKDLNRGLIAAAEGGNIDIVKLVIEKGTKNSIKIKWNRGIHGATKGGNINIVKLMMKKGVESLVPMDWNWGFLGAIEGGNVNIVKLMIEKSQNSVNLNDGLCLAAYNGDMNIVKLLIEKGAETLVLMNLNKGLYWASYADNMNIVKLLIEKGADNFNEGLCLAKRGGYSDMINLLKIYI